MIRRSKRLGGPRTDIGLKKVLERCASLGTRLYLMGEAVP